MPYVSWRDAYSIGHPLVDEQHKGIVRLVNDAYEALISGDELPPVTSIVDRITDLAVKHFSTEESLMSASGYPGFSRHRALHGELLERIQAFSAMGGSSRSIYLRLLNFMKDWIVDHMINEDRQLEPWFGDSMEEAG